MRRGSRSQLARAMVGLLRRRPRREVVQAVAAELKNTRRTAELPWFMGELAREWFKATGELEASVSSARKLTVAQRQKIGALVQRMSGARQVAIVEAIDKSLLGGFVVTTPQVTIDGSLKAQIKRLERYG